MAAAMTDKDLELTHPARRRPRPEPYVLVVGLGASGLAAARYLAGSGDNVVVIDSRAKPPGLAPLAETHPAIPVGLETLDVDWLDGASSVVLSPGLSLALPLAAEARRRGLPVIGELELFARAAPAPVLAVTGSNGKSTVTTLTARLLTAQGFDAPAGGNLGPPALELLERPTPDVYVLEVSSFQIETAPSLKPLAAALLNVTADHIDRHGNLAHYAALKLSLLTAAERAIYNFDDPSIGAAAAALPDAVPFSVAGALDRGWSVVALADGRWLARDRKPLIPSAELGLAGEIGEANSLAALALAECLDGDVELALAALPEFAGLPHRCRHVATRKGVGYVDDSKGTNVGAAVAAIKGAGTKVVLIAGGQGKGADFAPLADAAAGRVRAAVLIGEAAGELERAFAGRLPTLRADDMTSAVRLAAERALPGDWVLLSPACASQDMFADYRARGDAFAEAVGRLPA